MRQSLITLLAVMIFCIAPMAIADWNVGPGGNSMRNGWSSDEGPLYDTVLWEGGPFTHFPRQAAAEGNVYAVARTFDSSDLLHGTYLYALNVLTGAELWHIDLPVDFPSTDYRVQLIGINGGRIYATRSTNSNASYLYAINATDGSIAWKSEEVVTTFGSEGVVFAPDGDLVVGNYWSVRRIEGVDGTTIWDCSRTTPSSDGCGVSIFGDRCYCWQASGSTGPVVRVISLSDGSHLYDSGQISTGFVQQLGLFTGHDGTVYAPRSHNNPSDDFLVAYTDTGSELQEKWRVPLGYIPFSTFAVGPDGSVYSYDRNDHIVRLDPDDGSIINTSDPILSTMSCFIRAAVDTNGILYITAGDWPDGMLYSFNQDLSLRWSVAFPQIGASGPVLADGGILIIAGDLTDMVAYRMETGFEEEADHANTLILRIMNPVMLSACFMIDGNAERASLQIFDLAGRTVSCPWSGTLDGVETVSFDVSDLSAGAYIARLSGDGKAVAGRFIVVR